MRTTFAFTAILASLSAALAAPPTKGEGFIGLTSNSAPMVHNSTTSKTRIYMFAAKDYPNLDINAKLQEVGLHVDHPDVAVYNNTAFTAAVITSNDHCKDGLSAMAEVSYVEEQAEIQSFATQNTAPWGLQRISSDAGASGSPQGQDFTYTFDDESLGAGVDIYVIDTGVRVSHAVFTGRAQEGFSFTGSAADGDGHGTHVAGSAAGAKFGVAQAANIFAVKVLGDDGSGSSSDTIAGMDWVINNHEKRKSEPGFVGSIMSMSWGLQGTAQAVDDVILGAIDVGIHVSVAAGNDGADACLSTPSHNGGGNSAVVTVGSVNIDNQVSSFSNIGTCVDIYAPGEQILSAWNTGDNIINFLSGTSMACPHTSGVMAYLMAEDPAALGQNPAALKKKLLETAREGQFTGNTGGSANLLLSNGANGQVTAKRNLFKNWVVPDRDAKRTVTGSPAAWAKDLISNAGLEKRLPSLEIHSTDSPLRF